MFLKFLQRHEHSSFSGITGRKVAHVRQIPRVHVHVNEIAAADQPADGQVADFPNRHVRLLGNYYPSVQVQGLEPGIVLLLLGRNQAPLIRVAGGGAGHGGLLRGPRLKEGQGAQIAEQFPAVSFRHHGFPP